MTTRGIGLIATKSTPVGSSQYMIVKNRFESNLPTMILFEGMYLLATWSQPPGAAHKSMQHRADSRNAYFLFSWISLNAERARYPCSLDQYVRIVKEDRYYGGTYFASL